MSFEFDRVAHTYTLDGQRIPSVTDALGLLHNFDAIPWAVLENARKRGERVHQCINAYNRGAYAAVDIPEDVACYVDAWDDFMRESGAVVVQSEQPVYHKALRYAGTPDCVLSWKSDRRLLIPDVKVTWDVPPTVGSQTWAYAEAYKAMQPRRVTVDRGCVHLTRDGYKFHPRNDQADGSLFISCLNIWNWMSRAAA